MASATTTYAFIGSGKVSTRNAKALLQDELEATNGNLRFILPVTETHWNEGLDAVATFALKNDIPYEIVVDDSKDKLAKDADLREVFAEATKEHKVAKVTSKVVSLLAAAPSPKLVILWEDDDVEANNAFELADGENIPAYDLCNGFDKLEFEDDDGDPTHDADAKQGGHVGDDEDELTAEQREAQDAELEALVATPSYTEAQLDEMDFPQLKEIAEKLGIEVKARTRSPGYVKAILAHQDGKKIDPATGEIEHVVPEEADGSEDGKEAQTPEELEDEDAVKGLAKLNGAGAEDDADLQRFLHDNEDDAEYPTVVGSCNGCGGPVFAKGSVPEVTWFHAPLCPLVGTKVSNS